MDPPHRLCQLPTPAFLVDLDVVTRNTERMRETCKRLGVNLRAHMKTHKTIEGGILATGGTKRKICVSTIAEAEFYASNGFDDILYAYPISADKIPRCAALADKLDTFSVMFDSPEAVEALQAGPRPSGKKWRALMEVDLEYGRTGVEWNSPKAVILAQLAANCEAIQFEGLYAHCGSSYDCQGEEQIKQNGIEASSRLLELSSRLEAVSIKCNTVGTGSTPSCNQASDKLASLTELHPGNYIFNDYEQYNIGSCTLNDIACCVATRVISHKPSRNQLVVDCGFLALGHDGMQRSLPSKVGFCLVKGHPELRMVDMSQELGKLRPWEGELDFSRFPIGTMLFIVPWHSCLTAALHKEFVIHQGEEVMGTWTPVKGWY